MYWTSSIKYVGGFLVLLLFTQCSALKKVGTAPAPVYHGMDGMQAYCIHSDTVQSVLISNATAILKLQGSSYEATVTLYSKKDSIMYLSFVNSGFEIIRAAVTQDSIRVIDRINKIVYHTAMKKRFGYQYPVNFYDLQRIISKYYLCSDFNRLSDTGMGSLVYDMDEERIKKRISLKSDGLAMDKFEFYHQLTSAYFMGERVEGAYKVQANFILGEIEVLSNGGSVSYNRVIPIRMTVPKRKYTFTELI